MEETRFWVRSGLIPSPGLDSAYTLSAAAESLWKRWSDLPPAGQVISWYGDRPVLALWKAIPERLAGVLAGNEFPAGVSRQAASEAQVQIRLTDRDGRVLLGQVSGPQAMRTAAATRLPRDLSVSAANPAGETAEAGTRRQMLLAGLALIGAMTLGSGYFTTLISNHILRRVSTLQPRRVGRRSCWSGGQPLIRDGLRMARRYYFSISARINRTPEIAMLMLGENPVICMRSG